MLDGSDHLVWLTAIEMPVIGALFWLLWRTRRETDERLDDAHRRADISLAQTREALSAYKLEVARTYASMATLKGRRGTPDRPPAAHRNQTGRNPLPRRRTRHIPIGITGRPPQRPAPAPSPAQIRWPRAPTARGATRRPGTRRLP